MGLVEGLADWRGGTGLDGPVTVRICVHTPFSEPEVTVRRDAGRVRYRRLTPRESLAKRVEDHLRRIGEADTVQK